MTDTPRQQPDSLPPRSLQQKLGLTGGARLPYVDLEEMGLTYEIGAGGYLNYTMGYHADTAISINGATNWDAPLASDLITKVDSINIAVTAGGGRTPVIQLQIVTPGAASSFGTAYVTTAAGGETLVARSDSDYVYGFTTGQFLGQRLFAHPLPPGWLWRVRSTGGGAGDTMDVIIVYCTGPEGSQLPR